MKQPAGPAARHSGRDEQRIDLRAIEHGRIHRLSRRRRPDEEVRAAVDLLAGGNRVRLKPDATVGGGRGCGVRLQPDRGRVEAERGGESAGVRDRLAEGRLQHSRRFISVMVRSPRASQ